MSILFRGKAVAKGRNLKQGERLQPRFYEEKEGFVERLVKIVEAT